MRPSLTITVDPVTICSANRDRPGGHMETPLMDGTFHRAAGRAWAKRRGNKKARREYARVTKEAVNSYYHDVHDDMIERENEEDHWNQIWQDKYDYGYDYEDYADTEIEPDYGYEYDEYYHDPYYYDDVYDGYDDGGIRYGRSEQPPTADEMRDALYVLMRSGYNTDTTLRSILYDIEGY